MTRNDICRQVRDIAVKLSEDESLRRWCGICSTALAKLFIKHGYDATLCYGYCVDSFYQHCWIESSGKIYDITLTQFDKIIDKNKLRNIPEIFIDDIDYENIYFLKEQYNPEDDEQLEQLFEQWPDNQKPFDKLQHFTLIE